MNGMKPHSMSELEKEPPKIEFDKIMTGEDVDAVFAVLVDSMTQIDTAYHRHQWSANNQIQRAIRWVELGRTREDIEVWHLDGKSAAWLPKVLKDDRSLDISDALNVFGFTDTTTQFQTVLLNEKAVSGNEDSDMVRLLRIFNLRLIAWLCRLAISLSSMLRTAEISTQNLRQIPSLCCSTTVRFHPWVAGRLVFDFVLQVLSISLAPY